MKNRFLSRVLVASLVIAVGLCCTSCIPVVTARINVSPGTSDHFQIAEKIVIALTSEKLIEVFPAPNSVSDPGTRRFFQLVSDQALYISFPKSFSNNVAVAFAVGGSQFPVETISLYRDVAKRLREQFGTDQVSPDAHTSSGQILL